MVTVIPIVVGTPRTVANSIRQEEVEIRRRIETRQIVETGSNTEKSPGDLRRLAASQTPVKDHKLKLV